MSATSVTLPTEQVDALLPHRPPMQLLDAVLSCSDQNLIGRAKLRATSPFASPLGVPACIGLEYLGQAAAAFFSAREQLADEPLSPLSPLSPPRPGMLIASRSYSCSGGFFAVPADLLVTVKLASALLTSQAVSGLVKFSGTIQVLPAGTLDDLEHPATAPESAEPAVFAQGDLSVYLPPA